MAVSALSGVHLREARRGDVEALSGLLVQLYAHELPDMLKGSVQAQVQLARAILSAAPLGSRYVLERDGEILGTGSLATQEQPRPKTAVRTLLRAPLVVGPVAGVRTIVGGARGLLTIADPPERDEGQVHSVVVDRTYRRHGLGSLILTALEAEALRREKRRAALQVITSNTAARAFYRSAGYIEYELDRSLLRRAVTFPSLIMRKELQPCLTHTTSNEMLPQGPALGGRPPRPRNRHDRRHDRRGL